MGSLRVGHDWATSLSLSLFTFLHWRRKWQPTPVFLPEESRDGKAWWVAVYGIAQSRTRLKWLCSSNTVKGFGVFNEAEVDVFLELSCFFNDPTEVGNLNSGSSPFSKSSLNIWKFMAHVLLKYCLLHYWVKILWILHLPFLEWVITRTILSGKVRNYSKPYVCPCEYSFSFFQMVLSMAS